MESPPRKSEIEELKANAAKKPQRIQNNRFQLKKSEDQ